MFKYVEITMDNLLLATKIQMELFPGESAYEHYLYAINQNSAKEKYYLVYLDNNIVGITGYYSNEPIEETNSIWLGWYGVLKEYRGLGYGKKILFDTIDMTRQLMNNYPIKYFRLYTSEIDDAIAQPLYQKVMDSKEYYNHPDDLNYNNTCIIYTKLLSGEKIENWNNRFLNLIEIIEEQEIANKKFSDDNIKANQ